MPLVQKPKYINANDIPFFFTDGYYIDDKLYVPWDEVKSAIAASEKIDLFAQFEDVKAGGILKYDKEVNAHYCSKCGLINSVYNKRCTNCEEIFVGVEPRK